MKKKAGRKTREASRIVANASLSIACSVARQPGGLTALGLEMTRIAAEMGTDDVFGKQEVLAWTHHDEEKRVEPRLGVGTILIAAAGRIAAQNSAEE